MPIMSPPKKETKRTQQKLVPPARGRKQIARPGQDGGARQENRKRRIEALHRAATDLFLERGLAAVSVEDLAAAAGLSKAGFYRYYASLEALVAELMAPIKGALRDASDAAAQGLRAARKRDQLVLVYMQLGLSLTALVASEQASVRLYLQEVRGPAHGIRRPIASLAQDLDGIVLHLTEAAHAHGLLRSIEPEVSAQAVLGLLEHVLHRALRDERLVQAAEQLPALIGLVLGGVAKGDTKP